MTTEPCNCPQALALQAECDGLQADLEWNKMRRNQDLRALAAVIQERDALQAELTRLRSLLEGGPEAVEAVREACRDGMGDLRIKGILAALRERARSLPPTAPGPTAVPATEEMDAAFDNLLDAVADDEELQEAVRAEGASASPGPTAVEVACTCGSGLHPRRCEKHPQGYDLHWAQLTVETLDAEVKRLEAAAVEVRAAALEEAARAVEETDVVEAKPGYGGSYYAQLGDAKATLAEAAKAVRALKEGT